MNYTNVSFANPIKFYKNGFAGIHLDEDFARSQIKAFETVICYKQKWQFGDETPLQIVSTVAPSPVVVYSGLGFATALTFPWTLVGSAGSLAARLYQCTINLDVLPAGFYHLYFECTLLSYSAKFVSEKLDVRTTHPNTLPFRYSNSFNKLGVYFSTGVVFQFRCEAGIMDYQPEIDGNDYVDQIRDVSILSATPYDTFKLYIGEAPGVPNYVIKILNQIFACDNVSIRGMRFTKPTNEKWDATRVKGFPQFGWSTTIHPTLNVSGLQYVDPTELAPGIVLAYNIDTNLFSTEPIEVVHIEEITIP